MEVIKVEDLELQIQRKKSNKNIYIKVLPPYGQVKVTAPFWTPTFLIEEFVKSKLATIKKSQRNIQAKDWDDLKTFEDGEIQLLWGREYRLKVRPSRYNAIELDGDQLVLHTTRPEDLTYKRKILKDYYRSQLNEVLPGLFQEKSQQIGLKISEYMIRDMKTRWGTCNINKKRIWISLKLAKYDPFCLEYVVVHELCHLLERSHNKRFYNLVESFLPDWKRAVKILKEG